MKSFCTVITANYFPYAMTLYHSLKAFNPDVILHVFVSKDLLSEADQVRVDSDKNLVVIYPAEIEDKSDLARRMRETYFDRDHDSYRWGMKSVLLNHLLSLGHEKVIYLDSDLFFFNDYQFLFDQLNHCNVLLSPHWRCSDPYRHASSFEANFTEGIFNGGFVGASKGAEEALTYWGKCCLYKSEKNPAHGYFDDQRYLDILHSRFSGVDCIRHMGCNISRWNQYDCVRELDSEGRIKINGQFDIVFAHVTKGFFYGVLFGGDSILRPLLDEYCKVYEQYGNVNLVDGLYTDFERVKHLADQKGLRLEKYHRVREQLKATQLELKGLRERHARLLRAKDSQSDPVVGSKLASMAKRFLRK